MAENVRSDPSLLYLHPNKKHPALLNSDSVLPRSGTVPVVPADRHGQADRYILRLPSPSLHSYFPRFRDFLSDSPLLLWHLSRCIPGVLPTSLHPRGLHWRYTVPSLYRSAPPVILSFPAGISPMFYMPGQPH